MHALSKRNVTHSNVQKRKASKFKEFQRDPTKNAFGRCPGLSYLLAEVQR